MEIKLAIIGCGKWGMNHVKTANKILEENLVLVCDLDSSASKKVEQISKNIKFTDKIVDVINNPEINAVIVSTSAETHFEVAKKCLLAKKMFL